MNTQGYVQQATVSAKDKTIVVADVGSVVPAREMFTGAMRTSNIMAAAACKM